MQYRSPVMVALIAIVTLLLVAGCSSTGEEETQTESIIVTIDNSSTVGVYYVAFLPDGLDPETEPVDSWTVYSFGEDYVSAGNEGVFLLARPQGAYCSIFVGRNTFELSPIDKGWRWDQPYNGENLTFWLYCSEPPTSCMSMDGKPALARNYIDLVL